MLRMLLLLLVLMLILMLVLIVLLLQLVLLQRLLNYVTVTRRLGSSGLAIQLALGTIVDACLVLKEHALALELGPGRTSVEVVAQTSDAVAGEDAEDFALVVVEVWGSVKG